MEKEQARQLAETVAWSRIAIGAVALLAPAVPLRPWFGRDFAGDPRAKLLGRSLGARDLALGVGVILALRHEAPVRGWVEGAAWPTPATAWPPCWPSGSCRRRGAGWCCSRPPGRPPPPGSSRPPSTSK